MVRGIDAGNFQVKDVSGFGANLIPSDLAPYRERSLDEDIHGKHDLIVEYENKKYFAGTLAESEDPFSELGEKATMFGDTKAHSDAKLRILISIALSNPERVERIVVGQPIISHNKSEKEKIREMLLGSHEITINNETYEFIITDVAIAAEGAASYFSIPKSERDKHETVRIIDVGSGTINLATIYQSRKIDKGSTTLKFGRNTVESTPEDLAVAIIRATTKLKWNKNDKLFICGGSAKEVLSTIKNQYKHAEVITPIVQTNNGVKRLPPVFANAVGLYWIARGLYE